MAANLTNEKDNIEKVTFFMEECRRMGVKVLGPDVNESLLDFGVNKEKQIRFGLGAIKGTGESAANEVISEREKNGPYKDIFEFVTRLNLRMVNKKSFEAFAQGGAFDCFADTHRAMYFHKEEGEEQIFLEKIIKHGQSFQEQKFANQNSLFGSTAMSVAISNPKMPSCEPWGDIEKLRLEKDVVGFYISGHPLDIYRLEIENFCNCTLDRIEEHKDKEIAVAGVITKAQTATSKNGKPYCRFSIEDYNGSQEIMLFGQDYLKLSYMIVPGQYVYMKAKLEPKWNQIDRWELKPISLELLQDIRAKRTKKIFLTIKPENINSMVIDQLEQVILSNKGNCELRINLEHNGSSVSLFSRKYTVAPTNEFFKTIDAIGEIVYRVN